MTHADSVAYAHRHNRDGSIDSICTICFATVALVRDEVALAQHERIHCCPSWILADREKLNCAAPRAALTLVPRPMNKALGIAV